MHLFAFNLEKFHLTYFLTLTLLVGSVTIMTLTNMLTERRSIEIGIQSCETYLWDDEVVMKIYKFGVSQNFGYFEVSPVLTATTSRISRKLPTLYCLLPTYITIKYKTKTWKTFISLSIILCTGLKSFQRYYGNAFIFPQTF